MNILASYNWIKEYVALKESPEAFARKVSLCGPGVERLHPQAEPFDRMVIGKITAVKPHPNADKLRLATVDLGEREVTVVCGGINLAPEMKVAVALDGAMVRWHGQGDLIKLEPAVIRGIASEGMICAADEIGLAQAFPHADKEIMDLTWCKARPGSSLAHALDLEDTVFDIEVTTNRVDAFSIIGLAREAAAILDAKFSWKEPVLPSPSIKATRPPLTVKNRAEKLCPRYMAAVMENVQVGPSPWWLKKRLLMAGIRPVNNVVDITNYVMVEYGQPMHAFDYEKLTDRTLVVRKAEAGEKILALDGKEYEFSAGQLVIADGEKPVAVAGVMGGELTGVTEGTHTVVFEAAAFDPVHVRRTARALNLHSESSTRFDKGLPEEMASLAMARAVELCEKVACGRVARETVDLWPNPPKKVKFHFRPDKCEELIGVCIPRTLMVRILKSLGFQVAKTDAKSPRLDVTVPYWRVRDIENERDFAEEIARIYGYHNVPSLMPDGVIPLRPRDPELVAEDKARDFLAGAGGTELVTYSMISREVMTKAGEDPTEALLVANPLTVDFECMRMSLRPGVLAAIAANQGLFNEGFVFEVGRVFAKKEEGLPDESSHLMMAVWGQGDDDALIRRAKGLLTAYAREQGLRGLAITRGETGSFWHPGRSAVVTAGDRLLGMVGEIHPAVRQAFGLDVRVALVELDVTALVASSGVSSNYQPVPAFPPALRDLAVVVPEKVEYADLEAAAVAASPLLKAVELFDVYRGKGMEPGKKSVAVHLTFATDRTLTSEETDAAVTAVTAALAERFGATVR
jgi:phenylalanyl-tRNA synthetase beta chain